MVRWNDYLCATLEWLVLVSLPRFCCCTAIQGRFRHRWEIMRALPFNWTVISGKRGCRWGLFLLYLPFRTLAALSFAFAIIGVFPPQWQPRSVSLLLPCLRLVLDSGQDLTLHYVGEV